jgi:acetyl esterase/lipase
LPTVYIPAVPPLLPLPTALLTQIGLVPTARYPRQLQQAISLLDHVIYNLKKSPSNIILYGDAAGGNLATAVLSHLSHPHPSTTTPITPLTLPSKLRGVVLSSPWLSFSCTAPSFTHNANLDLRSPTTSLKWSAAFLGTSNTENYNQAATAPTEWWSDVQVEDVLIVAGGDEICVDDIRFFAGKLRSVKREVEFVVGEREAHGGPDLDLEMRFKDVGVQGVKVDSWLLEKF